jgi:DNA (cytosine-5)-methyltransferase 1
LWPEIQRIVVEVRPSFVFLENVARHLAFGFDVVAGNLQSLGYTVAAMVCRASTVGAPHQRERLFSLAVSDTGRERIGELTEWIEQHAPERWDTELAHVGEGLADPHGGLRQSGLLEPLGRAQRGDAIGGAGEGMGNANGLERDQGSSLRQSAGSGSDQSIEGLACTAFNVRRSTPLLLFEAGNGSTIDSSRNDNLFIWPPDVTTSKLGNASAPSFGRALNPRFVEWLMGYPTGSASVGNNSTPSEMQWFQFKQRMRSLLWSRLLRNDE